MNILYGTIGETSPRIYLGLSAIFGAITLVTFGTERYFLETTGRSVGDIPAVVIGSVVLAVAISAFYASSQHHEITLSILLALGPVSGLLVYLLGYHLVLRPSSDSPTWLLFIAFSVGVVAIGGASHILGRIITSER